MNLSLRGRVVWSFIIANVLVLGLAFTVFHFLNSLGQDMKWFPRISVASLC